MTTMSTGEAWTLNGYFGARIGVVVESIAFSGAVDPLSSLDNDSLYPRIRGSCERFPVHVRDDDGGVRAEAPASVPFEDFEAGPGSEAPQLLRGWVSSADAPASTARLLHRLRLVHPRNPDGALGCGPGSDGARRRRSSARLHPILDLGLRLDPKTHRSAIQLHFPLRPDGAEPIANVRISVALPPIARPPRALHPIRPSRGARLYASRHAAHGNRVWRRAHREGAGRSEEVIPSERHHGPGQRLLRIRRVRDSQAVKIGLRFVQPPEHREDIGAT